jgi:hypothetical protein
VTVSIKRRTIDVGDVLRNFSFHHEGPEARTKATKERTSFMISERSKNPDQNPFPKEVTSAFVPFSVLFVSSW